MADPRHHPLLCQIDARYKAANGGLPMPSPGRVAKALLEFLSENPKWTLETLTGCVRNRFESRGLNLAAPPHSWIKTLPQYAAGPLDEWGKPLKTETRDKRQETRDLEHAVEDYWARRMAQGGI